MPSSGLEAAVSLMSSQPVRLPAHVECKSKPIKIPAPMMQLLKSNWQVVLAGVGTEITLF